MATNYYCTNCGMRYEGSPGLCTNCGENAIIYDGQADRQREQETQARRAGQKGAPPTTTTTQPPARAKSGDWSWVAAGIAFVIGTAFAATNLELENGPSAIMGAIAGAVAGRFFKQILLLAVVAVVVFALTQPSEAAEPQKTEPAESVHEDLPNAWQ